METVRPEDMCVCGHPWDMHEHYREGSDCGACGYDSCPYFWPKAMEAS